MMSHHAKKPKLERTDQTTFGDGIPGWPGRWGAPSLLLSIMDDDLLIKEAMNGNKLAFTEMFIRYWNYVYKISWNLKFLEEDAEELAQDSFFKCFLYPYDKSKCPRFATYLWKLVKWGRFRNLSLDMNRQKYIPEDKLYSLDYMHGDDKVPFINLIADPGPSPEDEYDATELQDAIWRAYLQLKREMGAVFYLSVYRRLNDNEIVLKLGKNLTNVTSLLRLAKARVKVLMREDGYIINEQQQRSA